MKTYLITDNPTETIELKVDDDRFGIVLGSKHPDGITYKVITMNKREALNLYMALQEEILKPKGG